MTKLLAIDLGQGVKAEIVGNEIRLTEDWFGQSEIVMTVEQLHKLCEFIRENREHGK